VLIVLCAAASFSAAEGTGFQVSYAEGVHSGAISARVYVMLGPGAGTAEPRKKNDCFNPQPFFAVEATDWKPGEPLEINDAAAVGFPGKIAELKPGKYRAQAVIRLNRDTMKIGDGEGNAFGPIVRFEVGQGHEEVTALTVDQIVPPRPFPETERIKLVDIPSPLLSAFHGREIRHRAAVVLPEGYDASKEYPVLYIIPGFSGDHFMAGSLLRERRWDYARDFLRVVLSPDCGTGHHVFANSAFNGPRGSALIEELIPHIERTYHAIGTPKSRLLNGHSSGGWSSLWLQTTYPDFFGGTWSTSPDPVDFRDFQTVDLYAPDQNLFHDADGKLRPIARRGTTPILFTERFSKMEDVIGDGGQLHSFEAVFSPLDPDGRPRPLYDRQTGAVDPEVAEAWRAYDITSGLRRLSAVIGESLRGKVHIYTGELDTFYLEGAVAKLKEAVKDLGIDPSIEILPGKDHGNILDTKLAERLDAEMHEAVKD
jgi:hypothetical protein